MSIPIHSTNEMVYGQRKLIMKPTYMEFSCTLMNEWWTTLIHQRRQTYMLYKVSHYVGSIMANVRMSLTCIVGKTWSYGDMESLPWGLEKSYISLCLVKLEIPCSSTSKTFLFHCEWEPAVGQHILCSCTVECISLISAYSLLRTCIGYHRFEQRTAVAQAHDYITICAWVPYSHVTCICLYFHMKEMST